MTRFNTVQELIDGGYKLHAHCHNWHCQHNQVLDLVKLRERLNPDHSTLHDDLVPKLKCSKCGGKKIGLIKTPPSNSTGWVNPYIKSKGK
jgi:hypothetical protein